MEFFWENAGWEADDKHLKELYAAPFQRTFPSIQFDQGLYVVRGPRQIGKTTWLKTLLSECPDPKKVFYYSCDLVKDDRELFALLESQQKKTTIFLDEISFVKDWSLAVKKFIDDGKSKTLIITGSHVYDLRRGLERMPGRWGSGREMQLLPMDFVEFQKARRDAKWPKLSRVQELELFFRTGGFPAALIESGKLGADCPRSKLLYQNWLVGDALRLGKQEIYLRETLAQLAQTMTSSISLQKLAQRTQMGSHHTAQDYVSLLEDCFALRTLYAIDPDKNSFRFRKEKKFYFMDPLIYHIALEWSGIKLPDDFYARIAEQVAHEYLARKEKHFGYFHSPKGEIDFFKPKEWAIEVKWSEDARNLSSAFKNLVSLPKYVWTKNNFLEEGSK